MNIDIHNPLLTSFPIPIPHSPFPILHSPFSIPHSHSHSPFSVPRSPVGSCTLASCHANGLLQWNCLKTPHSLIHGPAANWLSSLSVQISTEKLLSEWLFWLFVLCSSVYPSKSNGEIKQSPVDGTREFQRYNKESQVKRCSKRHFVLYANVAGLLGSLWYPVAVRGPINEKPQLSCRSSVSIIPCRERFHFFQCHTSRFRLAFQDLGSLLVLRQIRFCWEKVRTMSLLPT